MWPCLRRLRGRQLPAYTFGHSNRSLETVVATLSSTGVAAVWDVRRFPQSRANPQFNQDRLGPALEGAGICYLHDPALGGRRRPLPPELSPNGWWRNPGFRGFADHALGQEFRTALAELLREAATRQVAILCSEALWWRCHRRIIADHLMVAGCATFHIVGPGTIVAGRLTRGAVVQPGGSIHYPRPAAGPDPPNRL
jgi:uncharacterized protein (DUF488 family)